MVNAPEQHLERLWLLFFGEPAKLGWWTRLMRPGFRHVSAAAWFVSEERWVHYNPTSRGTVIEIWTEAEFYRRLGQLMRDSHVILKIGSKHDTPSIVPFGLWCTGSIKEILGIRSRALWPRGLFRDLLARGAEIVPVPDEASDIAKQHPTAGPEHCSRAESGIRSRRSRPDSIDPGSIAGRDHAA